MNDPKAHEELQISGMTCVACAARIEKVLNRMPEVCAVVNLATEKALIDFNPHNTNTETLIAAVRRAGYDAHPARNFEVEKRERMEAYRRERMQFFISLLLTAPLLAEMLMMFLGSHSMQQRLLPVWLQWLLATPVQFWIGKRFYSGAWHSLRGGGANMDVLVALGTSAAYLLSCAVMLFQLEQPVYFEASAMLITLVLMGKLLEARAKGKASGRPGSPDQPATQAGPCRAQRCHDRRLGGPAAAGRSIPGAPRRKHAGGRHGAGRRLQRG